MTKAIIIIIVLVSVICKCDLLEIEPFAYDIPLSDLNEGVLKANSLLNEAKILFRNELKGPESLALAPNGDIITGTFGGHVWRINGPNRTNISKIATIEKGRPLGIRLDSKGNIYLADAFLGLYKIDAKTNKAERILTLNGNNNTNFVESKFFDDLAVDEGGGTDGGDVLYFSDVSTKFGIEECFYSFAEPDTTGRLVKYDINANQITVLTSGLWFPNGVTLNDDRTAVIFVEFTRRRVLKHYIKGPREGETQVLNGNLPAEPDNIRRSKSNEETYWIGLAFARNSSNPTIFDRLSSHPTAKKIFLQSMYAFGSVIEFFGEIISFDRLSDFGRNIKTGTYLMHSLLDLPGMAIEIDANGTIITSLQSPDNRVGSLSEVCEVSNDNNERVLYLGSYSNPYLGKLVLKTGG